jgi:hypothetical protein
MATRETIYYEFRNSAFGERNPPKTIFEVPWNLEPTQTRDARSNLARVNVRVNGRSSIRHEFAGQHSLHRLDPRLPIEQRPSARLARPTRLRRHRRSASSKSRGQGPAMTADECTTAGPARHRQHRVPRGPRALIAPQLGRWSDSTFGMHARGGAWGHTAHDLAARRLAAYWSRQRSR